MVYKHRYAILSVYIIYSFVTILCIQMREYKKEKWLLVGNAHGIEGPWFINKTDIWDEKHQHVL